MQQPDPERLKIWQAKASAVGAVVPSYFEVFPDHALILCGCCQTQFTRNLIPNRDEPTFICPDGNCKAKNWLPVYFDKKRVP